MKRWSWCCVALSLFGSGVAVAQEDAGSNAGAGASSSEDAGTSGPSSLTELPVGEAAQTGAEQTGAEQTGAEQTGAEADADRADAGSVVSPQAEAAPAASSPPEALGQQAPEAAPPAMSDADSDCERDLLAAGMDPKEVAQIVSSGMCAQTTVVTAPALDLKRVAGSAAKVNEKELNRFEYQDVHRALEKVPGIYVRGEDGYGLRPNIGLRGANSDRSSKVTLMEDGVPLAPAPYSAPAAYYFPATNRLVGIDVYKGPASIHFGPQTVGGAIDLRTRGVPNNGSQGLIDVAGGLEQYGRLHGTWGWGDETFGVLLEGVHTQSNGFKQLDGGGDTGFDKNEAMLKARYVIPSPVVRQELQLKLGLSNEDSDETYLGLTDSDFANAPYRRYAASQLDEMNWLRTQAQLSWRLRFEAPLEVTVTAYRHDFHRAWERLNRFGTGRALALTDLGGLREGNTYLAILRGEVDSLDPVNESLHVATNDRRFVSQGAMVEGKWSPTTGVLSHLVRFGARLHYDRIERGHLERGYLMQQGVMVPTGADPITTADNRASTLAGAVHVADEILWERLLVTPGVRVELIDSTFVNRLGRSGVERGEFMYPVVLPGAGALYQITDSLSVLGGVYRGFSPAVPSATDVALPEYSLNYEAGGRLSSGPIEGELIGFFNDYSNLTVECGNSGGCDTEQNASALQTNAGRVHVYGLEAVAGTELELPAGTQLRLNATYTLTLSRFLTSFISSNPQYAEVEVGDQLPYVPNHQGSLGATVSGDRWHLSASAVMTGEMREQAGQGEIPELQHIPARAVIDLAAGFRPTSKNEIYVTVENLLNTPYLTARRPFGARPGRPLFAQVGYKHSF